MTQAILLHYAKDVMLRNMDLNIEKTDEESILGETEERNSGDSLIEMRARFVMNDFQYGQWKIFIHIKRTYHQKP